MGDGHVEQQIDYKRLCSNGMSNVMGHEESPCSKEKDSSKEKDHRLTSTRSDKNRLRMSALKPECDTIG